MTTRGLRDSILFFYAWKPSFMFMSLINDIAT